MSSLYQIVGDAVGLNSLLDSLVDEDGNPRDPTEEEMTTLYNWVTETEDKFKSKLDSYGKYIANLKQSAKNAAAEKANFKEEMDRLTKRAKAYENRTKLLNGLLRYGMERLGMEKYKTDLFSFNIQNVGGKTVSALAGASLKNLPDEYLKPREIDSKAIIQAYKDGILIGKEGPENTGKLFNAKTGECLENIRISQPTALVIR